MDMDRRVAYFRTQHPKFSVRNGRTKRIGKTQNCIDKSSGICRSGSVCRIANSQWRVENRIFHNLVDTPKTKQREDPLLYP